MWPITRNELSETDKQKSHWHRRPERDTTLVFVHGILSSSERCWTHANGQTWPDLLASDPDCAGTGIYLFSYQTGPLSADYSISDAANTLKERLKLDKVLDASRLIFVCHSLGGLVVRRYLVTRAADLAQHHLGLFLLASPSLGSAYSSWLGPVAKLLGNRQAEGLRFVDQNPWLQDLDRDFVDLKESKRLNLMGKELVEDKFSEKRSWLLFKQVVPPFSGAKYFGESYKVEGSDHSSIAKPANHHAIQHKLLRQFIQDFTAQCQARAETSAKQQSEPPASRSNSSNEQPNITINGANGLVIGNANTVTQHFYQTSQEQNTSPKPANFPSHFHLPHRQNPDFVGRSLVLSQLAEDLASAQISAITPMVAATGLGGIGKTQLAIEFAYRNAHNYPGGVFWLNCAQAQQLPDELAHCGLAMGLFEEDDPRPLNHKVRAVTKAWHDDQRLRLLIFDNCEAEQILVQWAPKSRHHHILVTSRRQHWTVPGLKAHALATLNRSESVALLQTQLPDLCSNDAETIAAELADLPLALFLAARYLHSYRHQISPTAYLSALQSALTEHPSLQGKGAKGYQPTQHDIHVGRCFAVSLDRLDPTDEVDVLARQLLLHASYFAPGEAIQPKHLLATLANPAPNETPSEALQRLTELGLLRPEEKDQLSLHRLLAHYTQASQSNEARLSAEAKVIDTLVNLAIAANESGLPAQMSPILAHLRLQAEKHLNEASPDCLGFAMRWGNICIVLPRLMRRSAFFDRVWPARSRCTAPSMKKRP